MLKNLDPLLNADVLHALRAMGHGDTLVLSDTNFPSESVARKTVLGKLLRIDASCPRATRAILSVMPLDTFYPADESHRQFYLNNKSSPYCQIVINPKLEKLKKRFNELLKTE